MLSLERDRAEVIMESLRWLALLLSIVLLLQCIGSCLLSPLHRLERFAGNDLRAHFDVLVSMPSASVNVALFAMFYEDRPGAIPWAALAECAGALAALLVTERSRLARSPDVQYIYIYIYMCVYLYVHTSV